MSLVTSGLTIPPAAAINAAAAPRRLAVAAARSVVPLVYGEDRVTGLLLNVLKQAGSASLILVQVLWAHAGEGIHDVQLNDADLSASSASIVHYDGSQSGADATLVAAFSAQGITYTDTLAGYMYSVLTLPVEQFTGALNISARVRGRKLYDPRKDGTLAGGSGTHRLATPSTWAWSDNPALALADFLYSSTYGAGQTVSWTSVQTAANANDAVVGSPSEKRRLLGAAFIDQVSVETLADTLRAYAACWLVPTSGGIKLLPDADAAPVAAYAHATGSIAALDALTRRDLGSAPTAVEVIYTNRSTLPWRDDSVIVNLTGAGTTRPWRLSTVRMPGIHRYGQAKREATERLNKLNLNDLSCTLEVFDIGIRHELGDIVTLTHPLGPSAKPFRVSEPPEMAGPGRWMLPLIEHDPAVYSTLVQTTPSYSDTDLVISGTTGVVRRSLVDASWWAPGAVLQWHPNDGDTGTNSIVYGLGPRGLQQALWRCVAAGTPLRGLGWQQGTMAEAPLNAFAVDPTKAYRFAVPVMRESGTGEAYWGPSFIDNEVCALNTSTPVANPYFLGTGAATLAAGVWYLAVGYVFPAGATGLTNAGAGLYDMETGALVQAGANFCWNAAASECSTRAYLYAANAGATQYFGYPTVERMDGYQVPDYTYLGQQQVTAGAVVDSSTATGSSGSPGASTRVATLWGPTITTTVDDELDFLVSGVLTDTFWSQAVIGRVQVWLTHAPTFGGAQTEIGTRVKYLTPIDVYTNSTQISLDITGQIAPGAVTQDYVLRVSIDYIDAAGSAKTCAKDFTADAQWRVIRRKH